MHPARTCAGGKKSQGSASFAASFRQSSNCKYKASHHGEGASTSAAGSSLDAASTARGPGNYRAIGSSLDAAEGAAGERYGQPNGPIVCGRLSPRYKHA